jgi:hypothetical protein
MPKWQKGGKTMDVYFVKEHVEGYNIINGSVTDKVNEYTNLIGGFTGIYGETSGIYIRKEDAIEHAKGFIRYETVQQINLRVAPELHFKLDNTLDEAERMDALIKKTIADDEARAKAREAKEGTDKDGENS